MKKSETEPRRGRAVGGLDELESELFGDAMVCAFVLACLFVCNFGQITVVIRVHRAFCRMNEQPLLRPDVVRRCLVIFYGILFRVTRPVLMIEWYEITDVR